ncbi:putative ribonuclease H-like domain-containing protein [Tanacetum coccineum]
MVNTVKDKNVNIVRTNAVVNVARPKASVNAVKGNNVNVVKASACWVLKPKTKFLDHVSKHNSALITIKKFVYVDAHGKSNDETSGILKSFITGIENLVDHKVKVIRCDNGTEFKNREMNKFYEKKGILRQYSVARTPQQNRVAESRNMTLIEAARTMLTESKYPQPYEARISFTTSLRSNADEGSGPDWLFDIDALTRTMNYEPIVAGTQSNGFAGTKANDNAGQARKETKPVKDYILLPLWTTDPPFSQNPKSSDDDGFKPSSDVEKKVWVQSRRQLVAEERKCLVMDSEKNERYNKPAAGEQSYDEVYGCLKGGSRNSGGKRLAISMVEEAWLSEKKEV